jgi:acetylornithine/N-succinyldiaminopimelate aminotransferase
MSPDPFKEFLRFLAQTSESPTGLGVAECRGSWITATDGRRYLDWLAGIGVLNLGHRHPAVIKAISRQLELHLHVMVFGEYVQSVQVELARELCRLAPMENAQVYFTSSGAEAIEGAMKLARKITRRGRFAAFSGGYHGTTFGAVSLIGDPRVRACYAPLLDVLHLPYGDIDAIGQIDETVAGVIVEPIQAEAGVRIPPEDFLPALRRRCEATGALLIADEVQSGLGRTGRLWAVDHWNVKPDVIALAKALGGGLPLGAFLAPAGLMHALQLDPPLSHLTTFGGHPLSCAAGLAALRFTLEEDLPGRARERGERIRRRIEPLQNEGRIREVRGQGLLIGIALESEGRVKAVIEDCQGKGLLLGSALLDEAVLRITPPLTISEEETEKGISLLAASLRRN